MKRSIAAAVAALALASLTGCAAGKSEASVAAPAIAEPKADDGAAKEAALVTAGEGYTNALLSGDLAGVTGYLHTSCTESDIGGMALSLGLIKQTAKGATMKVTRVNVEGDRGGVRDYELSVGAPDALRRLIKSSMEESTPNRWRYVNGEWYFTGVCSAFASPSPTAS